VESLTGASATGSADTATSLLTEVHSMARDMGPWWALAFLIAVCIFCPVIGVLPLAMRLLKEDRQDDRKQGVELTRLHLRLQGRPKTPPKLPKVPPQNKGR